MRMSVSDFSQTFVLKLFWHIGNSRPFRKIMSPFYSSYLKNFLLSVNDCLVLFLNAENWLAIREYDLKRFELVTLSYYVSCIWVQAILGHSRYKWIDRIDCFEFPSLEMTNFYSLATLNEGNWEGRFRWIRDWSVRRCIEFRTGLFYLDHFRALYKYPVWIFVFINVIRSLSRLEGIRSRICTPFKKFKDIKIHRIRMT